MPDPLNGLRPPKPIITLLRQWATPQIVRSLKRGGYCVVVVESHEALHITRIHYAPEIESLGQTLAQALVALDKSSSVMDYAAKEVGRRVIRRLAGNDQPEKKVP